MGQCYTVELQLNCANEKAVADALRRNIEEQEKSGVRFGVFDRSTLIGLVKCLLTDRDFETDGHDGKRHFSSSFTASYGWENVMYDAFGAISEFLNDGSYLRVFPDQGGTQKEIKDGKVETTEFPDLYEQAQKLVEDIVEAVARLNEKTGALVSFMNENELELSDAFFEMLDNLKDGEEDIDEALEIILEDA